MQRQLVIDAYAVSSREIRAHIDQENRHHLRKVCDVELGG